MLWTYHPPIPRRWSLIPLTHSFRSSSFWSTSTHPLWWCKIHTKTYGECSRWIKDSQTIECAHSFSHYSHLTCKSIFDIIKPLSFNLRELLLNLKYTLPWFLSEFPLVEPEFDPCVHIAQLKPDWFQGIIHRPNWTPEEGFCTSNTITGMSNIRVVFMHTFFTLSVSLNYHMLLCKNLLKGGWIYVELQIELPFCNINNWWFEMLNLVEDSICEYCNHLSWPELATKMNQTYKVVFSRVSHHHQSLDLWWISTRF